VAALEVRASASRMPPSRIPELIEKIRDATAVITGRIGGVTASN
jgi:DNA-binding IclR family transcriptional regulator